jgi:predicted DNA-binding transcriptional regulator AlpA
VKPETAYTWRVRGVLPPPDVRIGRSVGWYPETIERFARTTGRAERMMT